MLTIHKDKPSRIFSQYETVTCLYCALFLFMVWTITSYNHLSALTVYGDVIRVDSLYGHNYSFVLILWVYSPYSYLCIYFFFFFFKIGAY